MIFLGQASNYSFVRILSHLFACGTRRNYDRLRSELAQKYQSSPSQVALYHSGRSALAVAFASFRCTNQIVILPGLTCIAVVRAIKAAGYTPQFVDIDPQTLQYDFTKLAATLQKIAEKNHSNTKKVDKSDNVCYNGIIVAQNTLGLPLDMSKLEQLAQKYHFCIVEDLAHSAGRFYPDGREIGTVGEAVVLSFGKGKAIDTICGGAVILREKSTKALAQPLKKPPLSTRLRDRWYPVLAGLSRTFWSIGLGKCLLGLALKLHWIEKSADTKLDQNTRLTYWQAKLASRQLASLPRTPLREHFLVQKRGHLLAELLQNGYNFREIWYDTPVSPARYAKEADFPATKCPNTIKVAAEIINLPTWIPEQKLIRAREVIQKYQIGGENA